MSLLGRILGKGPTGFGYGSTAEEVTFGLDLTGRNILVTGCNSGIGLETVHTLVKRGARVFAAARSKAKAAEVSPGIRTVTPLACELSDPASVRECAANVIADGAPLHAIVCNAGIMALPKLNQAHGYELQFFTNHIGHFLLVTSLLGQLAEDGRVVMLSSDAHKSAPSEGIQFDNLSGERGYQAWTAYGQSKVANLLFAKALARRFEGTKKTANAVHPGVIKTKLTRYMNPFARIGLSIVEPLGLKSPQEGAATQCYVAVNPGAAAISGEYWASSNVAKSTRVSRDPALAERLWEESEKIVARLP